MSVSTPTPTATEAASEFVNSRPFEWLARAGFVARGLVYGIIGLLALKLAIGSGGKATDQEGAMRTLAQQPLGRTMLVALAVGLAGLRDVAVHPRRARARPGGIGRGLRPRRRARERARLRRVLRARDRDPARRQRSEDREPEGNHRRRSQLARRPAPGRVGGPGLRRHRRLPGLPGRHPRLPPRLEDRGDATRGEALASRASAPSGISRAPSCSVSSARS